MAADSLITTVKYALAAYTYATIFINIIPVLQLLEKGKTESYTPKGEFKMQNGNLLFIKEVYHKIISIEGNICYPFLFYTIFISIENKKNIYDIKLSQGVFDEAKESNCNPN